jgi:hypothetical protein
MGLKAVYIGLGVVTMADSMATPGIGMSGKELPS